MILYVEGSLFQSPAQVLVNTVNTVGVMGKGIALEFKRLFPDMYQQYHSLCEQRKFQTGMLWLYKSPNKWVLNFPTKKHWRNPSRIEYIESGLKKFVSIYATLGIHSIAFPALGCGNGQLDFQTQVQPLMEKYLRNLPIEVFIHPKHHNPFVEHINQKEMARWLRSEPSSLPFSEVWEDIENLLVVQNEFQTTTYHKPFTAAIETYPPRIKIIAGKRTYNVPYELLVSFWQQLRMHGFSMRHIAPGLDRKMSYLTPIFAKLDYITPVRVADSYNKFQNSIVIGLQVLPLAFNQYSQYSQPSLFS